MLPKGAFRSPLMDNLPRVSFLISISLYRVVHDYFVAAASPHIVHTQAWNGARWRCPGFRLQNLNPCRTGNPGTGWLTENWRTSCHFVHRTVRSLTYTAIPVYSAPA